MKKRNLWAMSLIGLALTACTQDEEINNAINQDGEGTVVSLKIDFAGAQTKAAGDLPVDGTDEEATEAESMVSSLTMVVTDATSGNVVKSVNTGSGGGITTVTEQQTTKYEFKVPKGTYKFYAFANSNKTTFTNSQALIPTQLEATYATDYTSVYANNNFLMGNENGESEEYLIGTEPSYDVNITLERAAVKVTAKCDNPTLTDGATPSPNPVGKIHDVEFILNGLNKKTYLMAYNGADGSKRTCPTNASDYDFVQDENGDLKSGFSFTDIKTADAQNPLYCLENTQSTYSDANTTYVVFKTGFVPAKVVELNASSNGLEVKNKADYESASPAAFYVINSGDFKGNYILAKYWTDNKTTIEALEGKPLTADMLSAEFENGFCYFAAPINKQGTSAPYAYPVFRNDWYDLSITAIKLPGSPNIPDLNLDGVDITLTTTVKGWNYVTKDVNLGE